MEFSRVFLNLRALLKKRSSLLRFQPVSALLDSVAQFFLAIAEKRSKQKLQKFATQHFIHLGTFLHRILKLFFRIGSFEVFERLLMKENYQKHCFR